MKTETLNYDKKANKLHLLLKGTIPALANALRRIIIDDVPTLAIEDVEFNDNTSALYDEVIALAAEEGIDLTPVMSEGDRLEICYPNYSEEQAPPIIRSLVIGDQVWTLSWRSLQSNSVDDLSVGQLIPLG